MGWGMLHRGANPKRFRGVDVEKLIKMLVAGNLAGREDYKEIREDARLEDRALSHDQARCAACVKIRSRAAAITSPRKNLDRAII